MHVHVEAWRDVLYKIFLLLLKDLWKDRTHFHLFELFVA